MCWQSKRFDWEGAPGWRAVGKGAQEKSSVPWLAVSGLMVMGLVSGWSLANHSDTEPFLVVQPRWLPARILGGGWTCVVSFWPFLNSSGWWWLISSMCLTRNSCPKTTHANSFHGAWPGWAVSISVLPLTTPPERLHTHGNWSGGLFLLLLLPAVHGCRTA